MQYQVVIEKLAVKELSKIPKVDQKAIWLKIKSLESGDFLHDKALKGKHQGKYRKRSGNYRIVYFKENAVLLVTIIRVAHRKEVY